jgi:Xaa-Pro aminopeptidase
LFVYSGFSGRLARERSFIADVRTTSGYSAYDGIDQMDPMILELPPVLRERGVLRGRVGVDLEALSTPWHDYLRRELPELQLVEIHKELMEIRLNHSQEEAEIFRAGAALGDAGYEAAVKVIRPGVTEQEIAAEIEYAGRKLGVSENFTLVGSGKFAFGDSNTLPLPVPPSGRRIEVGDTVIMEITPRYEGYWTQLVRMVNVGRPNPDLQKMQIAARDAIRKGLEHFRPGKRVRDIAKAMKDYVDGCGFVGKPPFGHICGNDLVEDRVTLDNERVLQPGFTTILHPMVYTGDGKNVIFWGETYLATAEGYERLHGTTDELVTL